MILETEHLVLRGEDRTAQARHLCIALAHNEGNLLKPFLSHYRRFGDITFLVVDDRSTDGSSDFLDAQPDVTVMEPKPGSTYAEHKREWRGQALDLVADGRWILAPDIDEMLLWHGAPSRSFAQLIGTMEAEGAEALYAIMVDMYADKPISEHVFDSSDLSASFPFFDDPAKDPYRMWMQRGPTRFLQNWPTPTMMVLGGMRQRLAERPDSRDGAMHAIARRLFGRLGDHRREGGRFVRRFTNGTDQVTPINLTKVPMVKWRSGMRFYGGAHALNRKLRLATERAALLHFPITRGLDGIHHIISRGQHTEKSAYYQHLLQLAAVNPRYGSTSRLDTPQDLEGIITCPRNEE